MEEHTEKARLYTFLASLTTRTSIHYKIGKMEMPVQVDKNRKLIHSNANSH